jgi:hypothetical protein
MTPILYPIAKVKKIDVKSLIFSLYKCRPEPKGLSRCRITLVGMKNDAAAVLAATLYPWV